MDSNEELLSRLNDFNKITSIFLSKLQEETNILKKPHKSTDLENITEEKDSLTTNFINELTKLNTWLANCNLELTSTSLRKHFESLPDKLAAKLQQTWQQLNKTIYKIQYQNNLNGAIIRLNHLQTTQLVNFLYNNGENSQLYGADANTYSLQKSNSIIKA